MPRIAVPLFLVAAAALAAAGQPEVKPVPAPPAGTWAELRVAAGELVVLSAAPASEWDADPAPHTFEAGKYAAFVLKVGESRRVTVTGPDKSKTRLVLVGTAGPAPKPPAPPAADPLRERLKAAYDADPEADPAKKRERARLLAELYRQAADLAVKKKPKADDGGPDEYEYEHATSGELVANIRRAADGLVGPSDLQAVRKVVAGELAALLPADAPLTGEQRAAAADLFKRLAAALNGF